MNKGKHEKHEEWYGSEGAGWMYDYYLRRGHLFKSKISAFQYLKKRIDDNPKTLVKSAKELYNRHIEYHI